MSNFIPAKNKILVKPVKLQEKVTNTGILLPDSARDEKALRGIVAFSEYSDLNVGDEVLFSKFGYDDCEIDGERHCVVSVTNILGVFK